MEHSNVKKSSKKIFLYLVFAAAIILASFYGNCLVCNAEMEQSVHFIEPQDGAVLSSPITIKMGVKGMTVKPAGELVDNTGHHHLVIDGGFIEKGQGVPADATHIHYGKGQTETTVELSPGKHSLTLQFADGLHRSYGKDMSATINVEIK